jgi:hypothetical protein
MGWRERRNRPPTLAVRLAYAFVGLVSGGLLSLITVFPLGLRSRA